MGEGVTGPDRIVECGAGQRHERHHVGHAESGMDADVRANVDAGECVCHQGSGVYLDPRPTQREHTPVMVRVTVPVEKRGPGGGSQRGEDARIAALTDVYDALEHPATLARVDRLGQPYDAPVDVGLALPHYDHSVPGESPLQWSTVVAWAQGAEQAGFASVWLSDHLFLSLDRWGGEAGEVEGFEALTALAGLAEATSSVRLGTLVLCPHLRPTGVVAKALATIDVLSNGRLTIGLGAGWFEPEYTAAGLPFPPASARVERLEETIEVLRLAFTGEPFSYAGRHITIEQLACRPKPVQQPAPPIWVGGTGNRLLRVVARGAEGWNAGGWTGTAAEYRGRSAVLDHACETEGRDPATVTRSVNRMVLVGEDEQDLHRRWELLGASSTPGALRGMSLDDYRQGRLVGTIEQVREELAGWAAEGVTTLIISLGALPFTVTGLDDLEVMASATREH